jgi:glycosidase
MSQNQDKNAAGFGGDHEIRHDMIWDSAQWDNDVLSCFKALISLRHQHPVLRRGTWQPVVVDSEKQVFGYKLADDSAEMLVFFNLSDLVESVSLEGVEMVDVLVSVNGETAVSTSETGLTVILPELGGGILVIGNW